MAKDFYSFDRVLRELHMEEEELKRLVSEGEIRAFRDQDKMKFKKEEVERFRGVRDVDTAETLGDEDMPEELVFDEDDADQEVGMATAAISDDSFLGEDEPLELEAEEEDQPRARSRASATTSRRPRVMVDEPEEHESPMWTTAYVVVAIVLVLGCLAGLDAARAQPTSFTQGLMEWVGSNFNKIDYSK